MRQSPAAATFPVLFINVSHGTAELDRGLLEMARVYRLPPGRVLFDIILPGTSRYALAAFSFALGITWKVTATAEFFGSGTGIGARIYWAYRQLDMPVLFAWTTVIIPIGMGLETGLIQPLRQGVRAEASPREGEQCPGSTMCATLAPGKPPVQEDVWLQVERGGRCSGVARAAGSGGGDR